MKINRLNSIIILGLVATIGILVAQLIWTYQAFTTERKKFSQKVHVALLEVARELYETNGHEFSTLNLIQKVSNDYYVVNMNDDIDPLILEHYLKQEFTRFNIITDYEFAIYNCESDEMMYGKYVSIDADSLSQNKSPEFAKFKDLVYYFAIRFPQEQSYLFSSLKFWLILSFSLMVILIIYVYSIYTLLQQKKYSELQKDFINNMTHEFKTPLSSILLASNYLHTQEIIVQDEKLEKYTGIIIEQGKKLNHHIEKILNIARNDEMALALKPVTLSLGHEIHQVADALMMKYEHLIIRIDIDADMVIQADAFHFNNVVQNILENAIKYCDKSPEITIQASLHSKGILLEFIDNGPGVDSKNISFIFDKFYRVSSKDNKSSNGFGLGLYYVKRIIAQHNWKIWASNGLKEGLNISILFTKK